MVYAVTEGSAQPVLLCRLIRGFIGALCHKMASLVAKSGLETAEMCIDLKQVTWQ